MRLSSTLSQRPANPTGESEISTRRSLSAPPRAVPTHSAGDDFLLPLLDVARHVNSYADAVARAHGLTQPQLIVIARLERQPHLSLDELAALAGVTRTALAGLIDNLETLGMVERRCDAAARRTWLRLAQGAAPLLHDIKLLRGNLQRLATSGIDPAVLKTMVSGLRRTDELFRGVDHIAFA
jgi:MarR family transcriptional regulator, transcriptional regulator for hemolysin